MNTNSYEKHEHLCEFEEHRSASHLLLQHLIRIIKYLLEYLCYALYTDTNIVCVLYLILQETSST